VLYVNFFFFGLLSPDTNIFISPSYSMHSPTNTSFPSRNSPNIGSSNDARASEIFVVFGLLLWITVADIQPPAKESGMPMALVTE
jgi:hypothetical protein